MKAYTVTISFPHGGQLQCKVTLKDTGNETLNKSRAIGLTIGRHQDTLENLPPIKAVEAREVACA